MFSILRGKVTLRRTTPWQRCEERAETADNDLTDWQAASHSPEAAQTGAPEGENS